MERPQPLIAPHPGRVAALLAELVAAGYDVSLQQARPADGATSGEGLADWQVKRATRYMADHLDEEISLAALASLVGLSRFHFCTAFRRATGQAPIERLTGLRIAEARQLLMLSDRSITEIALEVGYQTPSAFAASFRRRTGTTPSDYRRRRGGSWARPVDRESGSEKVNVANVD